MPHRPLPTDPSMAHLRREAKRLLDASRAAESDALALVLEFKFDLNAKVADHTAMHSAAWMNRVDIIRLLIELGANPSIRDGTYNGTPLDWAEYNQQPDAADYLRTYTSK